MKKLTISYLALLCIIGLLSINSCDDDNDPTNNVCQTTFVDFIANTTFSTSNGYKIDTTMDLLTHEYQLQFLTDGEICSVGYTNHATYDGSFTISIIGGTPTYTGDHSFSKTTLDYQTIPPIQVSTGDVITVRRTILPGTTMVTQLIGPMYTNIDGTEIVYPITSNKVIFLNSKFYDDPASPINNFGQPLIGLGFKLN